MKPVRLWTVGYLNTDDVSKSLVPTTEMLSKVRNLIHDAINTDNQVIDIIWGPDLTVTLINGEGISPSGELLRVAQTDGTYKYEVINETKS